MISRRRFFPLEPAFHREEPEFAYLWHPSELWRTRPGSTSPWWKQHQHWVTSALLSFNEYPNHDFWHFALLGIRRDNIAVKTFFRIHVTTQPCHEIHFCRAVFLCRLENFSGHLNSLSWSFCRPGTTGCFSKRMKLCQVRTQFCVSFELLYYVQATE